MASAVEKALPSALKQSRPYSLARSILRSPLVQSLFIYVAVLLLWLFVKQATAQQNGVTKLPWDAGWYRTIVDSGYMFNGNYNQQSNIAFSPLYPLICRALVLVLHLRTVLAMYVVAGVFFYTAILCLYLLVAHLTSQLVGFVSALVFATNPFALFMLAGYGDVAFVGLSAATLYFLEVRKQLFAASVLAGLASISRPYGVLLAVPVLVEVFRRHWPHGSPRAAGLKEVVWDAYRYLPWTVLPLTLQALWFQLHYGDAMGFLHAHDAWRVCGTSGVLGILEGDTLRVELVQLFSHDIIHPQGVGILYFFVASAAWLICGYYRRLPLTVNVYTVVLSAFLFYEGLSCGFISLGRHLLPCFGLGISVCFALVGLPVSGAPILRKTTSHVLISAGCLTAVNVFLLCNYISRFYWFEWVG